MLTALELENFKGVSGRQRIDFAPVTLLFGANSAGKSTILQALLYLHELLEHGDADVDRTTLGGQVVELGGFARLVHRHERARVMVLRAEFETSASLQRFREVGEEVNPFPNLDDEVRSAWVELAVQYRQTAVYRGPLVDRVVIGLNGDPEPIVWIDAGPTLREGEWLNVRVNTGHPLLGLDADMVERWQEVALPEEIVPMRLDEIVSDDPAERFGFTDGRALPVLAVHRNRMSALPSPAEPISVIPFDESARPDLGHGGTLWELEVLLDQLILGTTHHLTSLLRSALYIGPLRTIPPRGYLYERRGRLGSWGDGLAAWDLLLADRTVVVERTNQWLRRLNAGCRVVVQDLFAPSTSAEAISEGHVDQTVRRLLLHTGDSTYVLPSEVGAGISQVVPVVVAAVAPRLTRLVAIEQPELHVHPALQVGLGDLLIEASADRTMLVETHSEHLILRLLRRIREAHEGPLEGSVAFSPEQLSVLYVESTDAGVRIQRLRVGEDGQFLDLWPRGFFDERYEELYGSP